MTADPLILTLTFDDTSFARLDALRRRYFPPARNFIPAHLTLFHHLPGDEIGPISETLAARTRSCSPFPVTLDGMRFLGRGTAITVASAELERLRADLAERFASWLTPQDRQRFKPHVTIQNKVAPDEAKATFDTLSQAFAGFDATAIGLSLWHYRGGPWEPAATFPFAQQEAAETTDRS